MRNASDEDDFAQGEQQRALILAESREIESLYPRTDPLQPNSPYAQYMSMRKQINDVIRNNEVQRKTIMEDIADTLMEYDPAIPKGLASIFFTVVTLGQKVREKRRKRELYQKVVLHLLEKIFDPGLEFQMRYAEILDAFEFCGMNRHEVTHEQIGKIYVKILGKLETGEIRDLTYEMPLLYGYVRLKIRDIRYSRQDWELNHR